jgi:hypothetical protein
VSAGKLELFMADLGALVNAAREACGCYQCAGLMDIGHATLANPDKAGHTPMSCLAPTILRGFMRVAPCAEVTPNG